MSDLSRPSQSDFIREMQRLHAAQLAAGTDETAREAADADLSHFLRMASMGRLSEYFASHGGGWTPVGS